MKWGALHPECPARLSVIRDHLISLGIDHFLSSYEAPLVTFEQLYRVHMLYMWSVSGSTHLRTELCISIRIQR